MWIVRIALSRPYTFIVLALLILSPVMILRTDIFPNINIPVVAAAWTYTGMNPEELEGRLTSVYERVLTALVDNIEHIESTTVNGLAVVKIYLQHEASLDTANAQVTAASQTILRQLPPGTLPPLIILALVRDGKARLVSVKINHDYGNSVDIVSSLQPTEAVIADPSDSLVDGTPVRVGHNSADGSTR